ncbi:hypothetical protein M514_08582, partial [Trichuris suis]
GYVADDMAVASRTCPSEEARSLLQNGSAGRRSRIVGNESAIRLCSIPRWRTAYSNASEGGDIAPASGRFRSSGRRRKTQGAMGCRAGEAEPGTVAICL